MSTEINGSYNISGNSNRITENNNFKEQHKHYYKISSLENLLQQTQAKQENNIYLRNKIAVLLAIYSILFTIFCVIVPLGIYYISSINEILESSKIILIFIMSISCIIGISGMIIVFYLFKDNK